MENKIKFFSFILLFLFSFVHAYADNPVLKGEHIRSFESDIVVSVDGSTHVTETIVYDFGRQDRHGIFREIPSTKAPGARVDLKIHSASVVDEKGVLYPVDIDYSDGLYLKIGDPNRTIQGVHTYKISYTTDRSLGSFDTFDELYWNVSGNGWGVPIGEIRSRIVLPGSISVDQLKIASYCGGEGSTSSCGNMSIIQDGEKTVVEFLSDEYLDSNAAFGMYEGMTVAVGFPKGVIFEKPLLWWQKESTYLLGMIVGVGLILVAFLWWIFSSYLPLRRKYIQSIVPEYDSPADISPSIAGFVYKTGSIPTARMATADILYLAVEGYITIEVKKAKKFFKEVSEFTLTRTSKEFTGEGHVASLYNFITQDGGPMVFGKNKNKTLYKKFDAYAKKINTASRTLNPDLSRLKKNYKKIFVASFVLSIALFYFFVVSSEEGTVPSVALVCWVVFAIVFISFLGIRFFLQSRIISRTPLWYKIAGLRYYIKIAEQDRIKFHSDPENSARIFSHLLPYAVIFGLEDKWTQIFDGIITELDWYKDQNGTFSRDLLLISMHSLSRSVSGATNMGRPSSVSGSSGGGFSGGGGGGGGGGSW